MAFRSVLYSNGVKPRTKNVEIIVEFLKHEAHKNKDNNVVCLV